MAVPRKIRERPCEWCGATLPITSPKQRRFCEDCVTSKRAELERTRRLANNASNYDVSREVSELAQTGKVLQVIK